MKPSFRAIRATFMLHTDGLQLQTGSSVWTIVITLDEETNLLAFSAEFLSEEGAEGILQIFFNGELAATVDERTAVEGIVEYIFSLPETLEAGDYLLEFRLDPLTDVASNIQIDNITMGYIVPEIGGDFDGDGDVDGEDFLTWRRNDGSQSGLNIWQENFGTKDSIDFDDDGDVDGADFLSWQRNGVSESDLILWRATFGDVASPNTAASAIVPEPPTGIMLMLGMAAMLSVCRAAVSKPIR